MGNAFSIEYEFEELAINIDDRTEKGAMFHGKAELVDNGDGDFYVSTITLESGTRLKRPSVVNSGDGLRGALFKLIAAEIENQSTSTGRNAAMEWADALELANQPDPDRAYDEARDHQAMGWI